MSRRRGRSQLDTMDEINLTPMIDLVFLLLIVFMITTPLLENALDVSPPVLNAEAMPDSDLKMVEVDQNGKVYFDQRPYNEAELKEILKKLYAENPKLNLCLRADGDRLYKHVTEVLGMISAAGFKNVNLVTQEEK